jgi:maltooligosyltrehalose trehalohydrolase
VNIGVWAPFAKSVELVTPNRRIAMRPRTAADAQITVPAAAHVTAGAHVDPDDCGYWQVDVDESSLSEGYRYSIDGGEPRPDPRSKWQPQGVHGASYGEHAAAGGSPNAQLSATRQRAAGEFPIAAVGELPVAEGAPPFAAAPLTGAVIYEMHVGTFTPEGTYSAAQAKLPHLLDLGITHLELMPVATFPGRRGWGYDGVDLYAPFPAYGSRQELAAFVQACHSVGIAVVLDVVYNHLGPDGNYLAQFGPYFTDHYRTPWGMAINYDGPHSDEVRRFVIDNALMWLRDYEFDGLRLDAVHAIYSFEAVHLLEEMASAVKKLGAELGRTLVLIAESDSNDPRLVRPPSRGGYGLDAHWADDFHHSIHRLFTGESQGYYADFGGLPDMAAALREAYVYQGRYSQYRRRRHGRPPTGVGAHQLIVFAQNHDQVGNRAQGERLSMMLTAQQLKAVAALTLLSPFVPLLFQGEEWGARTPFLYFTDHENKELGRLVAEGRSKEFSGFRWQGDVPNPQEPETFERSKLDWSEMSQPAHAELFEWYRQLIRLRRAGSALRGRGERSRRAKAAVKFDERAGWLRFNHGGVLALFNLAAHAQRVPMPDGEWDLALRSDSTEAALADEMPGQTTRIYTKQPPANRVSR